MSVSGPSGGQREERVAVAPQDPRVARALAEAAQEHGLADAGLARHEHEPPARVERGVEPDSSAARSRRTVGATATCAHCPRIVLAMPTRAVAVVVALVLPLALDRPAARRRRRSTSAGRTDPAHFWIVLAAGVAERRAGDRDQRGGAPAPRRAAAADRARVPGQRRVPRAARARDAERASSTAANAGFVLATPIGLVAAGAFAAASAVEYRLEASLRIVQPLARADSALVLAVIAAVGGRLGRRAAAAARHASRPSRSSCR